MNIEVYWYWNRIFWQNKVETMVADALAPCVTRSSAAMALIMEDEGVIVYFEEGFYQFALMCWENASKICFLK